MRGYYERVEKLLSITLHSMTLTSRIG